MGWKPTFGDQSLNITEKDTLPSWLWQNSDSHVLLSFRDGIFQALSGLPTQKIPKNMLGLEKKMPGKRKNVYNPLILGCHVMLFFEDKDLEIWGKNIRPSPAERWSYKWAVVASKVSMVRGPSCVVVLQTADTLNRKRNTANGCKKSRYSYTVWQSMEI